MAAHSKAGKKNRSHDVFEARVVRVDSRMCHVVADGQSFKCRIRGTLFRKEKRFSRPIAVGDIVVVERNKIPPHVINEVKPRQTFLARKRSGRKDQQIIAANVDQAVIVLAVAEPTLNPRLLDRMLVAVERGAFKALVVLNKIDLLLDVADLAPITELYQSLDYRVVLTSATSGAGLDHLRAELKDHVSVFTGMSGVGKSALLTAVQPDLKLVSAQVSSATGKGKHTTTHASLLSLEVGGFVVDTPGIREFGMFDLEPWELGHQFVEFRALIPMCRFRNCTHDHESRCAVKAAVDGDEIDAYRYDSYLRILESLKG